MIYRLFIAAELPQTVKNALAAAQVDLRGAGSAVKWVAPAAMHLTLRFLGDTSADEVPPIAAAMREALAHHPAMRLRLAEVGAFPNMRRPSVIWAGVGGATAELERAQADLEAGLSALGIPPEVRPFRAHLTLGRVRREGDANAIDQLRNALRTPPKLPPIAWAAERVMLFRSDLRREGPIYTEIADCKLQIAD